jgi:hypothetical protein
VTVFIVCGKTFIFDSKKAHDITTCSAIQSYPPLIAFEPRYKLNASIDLCNLLNRLSVLRCGKKIYGDRALIGDRIENKPEYMNV